jgi:hypothetical protein
MLLDARLQKLIGGLKNTTDDWIPTINNMVVAILVVANIIYISLILKSFAKGNKHNPAITLSGATTFTPSRGLKIAYTMSC